MIQPQHHHRRHPTKPTDRQTFTDQSFLIITAEPLLWGECGIMQWISLLNFAKGYQVYYVLKSKCTQKYEQY